MQSFNILIVDDDPNIRKLLRELLKGKAGYNLLVAEDGKQAVRFFSQQQIHVVLTDIHMPGVSGLEMMDDMHRLKFKPQILVMTANGTPENVDKARKIGARSLILKPFDNLEVIEAEIEKAVHAAAEAAGSNGKEAQGAAAPPTGPEPDPVAPPAPAPTSTPPEKDAKRPAASPRPDEEVGAGISVAEAEPPAAAAPEAEPAPPLESIPLARPSPPEAPPSPEPAAASTPTPGAEDPAVFELPDVDSWTVDPVGSELPPGEVQVLDDVEVIVVEDPEPPAAPAAAPSIQLAPPDAAPAPTPVAPAPKGPARIDVSEEALGIDTAAPEPPRPAAPQVPVGGQVVVLEEAEAPIQRPSAPAIPTRAAQAPPAPPPARQAVPVAPAPETASTRPPARERPRPERTWHDPVPEIPPKLGSIFRAGASLDVGQLHIQMPIVCLQTWEERGAITALRRLAADLHRDFFTWSSTRGIMRSTGKPLFGNYRDPGRALEFIRRQKRKGMYVLADFRQCLEERTVVRLLREMVMDGQTVRAMLVLTAPRLEIPPELQPACAPFDWPGSNGADLGRIFAEVRAKIETSGRVIHMGSQVRDALLEKVKEMPVGRARFEIARALLAGG